MTSFPAFGIFQTRQEILSADELRQAAEEIRAEVKAYAASSHWWRPLMSRQHLTALEQGRTRFQVAVDFLIKLATLRVRSPNPGFATIRGLAHSLTAKSPREILYQR